MTNQSMLDRYLATVAQTKSAATLKATQRDLRAFLAYLGPATKILQVQPQTIQAYLDGLLAQGQKLATVKRQLSSLRQFYQWLLQRDLIYQSPAQKIKLPVNQAPVLTKGLTAEQQAQVLAAAHRKLPLAGQVALQLMLELGLRPTEVLALTRTAVNFETNTMTISGEAPRVLRLSVALVNKLNALENDNRLSNCDILIKNQDNQPLSINGLYYWLRVISAEVNFKVTSGQLRLTARNRVTKDATDIAKVQQQFGDRSEITTIKHWHHDPTHLRADYQRYFKR
ncbi:tyrosine-type recombinase/integrase [Limosilactobacillus equigenerosi]|uniref:Integrase n=1 Tax=Limosilactobacillus equigenerosi DSM 18793 = JCM 14505 TaxID=1423742 RepID=A0A0R1UI24_9LACO|nr:site-specific integrase [Limosilactobacillus equigenerosi]KRL93009.1 hypothetical protein FC21_GL000110 [Limosilactobacillus equigenerosi DSM 18793 = JCM 14505]